MIYLFRLFCLLVVLTCLTGAITIAYSQVSSPEKQAVVVGEKNTFFSWGVVALLLMASGAATTAIVQSRSHINNRDVHHSGEKLSDKFMPKGECQIIQSNVDRAFGRIHERLDEQTKSLSRIEGKLDNIGGR